MKYVSLITLLCISCCLYTSAQKIEKGNLDTLKNQNELQFEINYSQVSICGQNEEQFAQTEKDWYLDRPRYEGRLYEGINNYLTNNYFIVSNTIHSKYKATLYPILIDRKGNIKSRLEIVDTTTNNMVCIVSIYGEGGTFGTMLNLIGDGMQSTGKQIGLLLSPKNTTQKK